MTTTSRLRSLSGISAFSLLVMLQIAAVVVALNHPVEQVRVVVTITLLTVDVVLVLIACFAALVVALMNADAH